MKNKKRCRWVIEDEEIYVRYHDQEWGRPVHDDRVLFEFLILEGAQAGLSWLTILRKRENYRKALDGFEPKKIARYGEAQIARLLGDAGIVRNRLKIAATIQNARCFLEVQVEFGSFDRYLWSFTGGKTLRLGKNGKAPIPARTPESDALSKDLKKRGFKFVGSTICYAWMQACGLVNDHTYDCFRYNG